LPLRRDVGAGDLVSDYAAAIVSKQLVNQTVLDDVGLGGSLWADRSGKRRQPLVIDPGSGQKFG